MTRFASFLATLLFVAGLAVPVGAFDLSAQAHVIFSSSCTDTNSVPATETGALSVWSDFDTVAEAVDPSENRRVGAQTSGSADGWCDDNPTIIATASLGAVTTGEDLYIGPIQHGPEGFYWIMDVATLGTNWSVDYMIDFSTLPEWDGSIAMDLLGTMTDSTSTSALTYAFSPIEENSTSVSNADRFFFPRGAEAYLRVDLNGTASWTFDLMTLPIANPHPGGSR